MDDLELVVSFLNTLDEEEGTDDLDTADHFHAWLTARGLADGATDVAAAVNDAGLERARGLRSALRDMASAHHDQEPDPQAAAAFDALAHDLPLRAVAAADGEVRPEPAGQGLDAALGWIVAAVVNASAVGTWPRVKVCSADTCRWAFVDASKNRSRRWCAMGVCGNRQKTRAYRQRQREST